MSGSQYFADVQSATFSGNKYGRAEVGITDAEMRALIDATTLKMRFRGGYFGAPSSKFAKKKRDDEIQRLIPLLNSLDARIGTSAKSARGGNLNGIRNYSGQVHRPYGYVPYYNSKGQLKVPNEGAIKYQVAKRFRSGRGRASTHRLMPVLGRKHMAIIGFVTRPKVCQNGNRRPSMDWSPGNLMQYRKRAVGQKKGPKTAMAMYTTAGGKTKYIYANSTSRLEQLLYNTGGRAAGVSGFAQLLGGSFRYPVAGNSGLSAGESIRIISGQKKDGSPVSRYAIVKASGAAKGYVGVVGYSDVTSGKANQRARARQAGRSRPKAFCTTAPGSSNVGNVVMPSPMDTDSIGGRVAQRRRFSEISQ